jgi:N-acetyl-gamma-glutamyl-phosphate reductase
MTRSVFIDGAVGTTGLEIADRLSGRPEFSLIMLPEDRRKDDAARAEALNAADFVILCLPDDAAVSAVGMIANDTTRVIDASSAHRVADGWTYGFPEVIGRDKVAGAMRVSNPGCYPTGFIALLAPLIRNALLPSDWPYVCHAVSGYSGGGKALIGRFENDADIAFRTYGLEMNHKHVPEMTKFAGLTHAPVFAPAVIPAHRGMVVEVPLPLSAMAAMGKPVGPPETLRQCLAEAYAGSQVVTIQDGAPTELLLRRSKTPSDRLDLYVFGSEDGTQARLVAMLDNLGKGASGAAVQNMNIMAGLPETAGLVL